MSKWIFIDENDHHTYPREGHTVLVSDGVHYDTAYYIMSQSYYWLKENVLEDDCVKFTSFEITCWKIIDENKYYGIDKNRNR